MNLRTNRVRNQIGSSVLFLVLLCSLIVFPNRSAAYFSTMDTGDITANGRYRIIAEPQIIIDKYEGLNMTGRFSTGLTEDSAVEALVGAGEVDFQLGGFYKWVPFPDVEGQPAIGGKAGVIFARVKGETEFSLRFHPLVSKKFETEAGDITPYASLPIGITNRDDTTFIPVQLAGGAEWKTLSSENLRFMAEIGFNISKAFPYVSVGLVYEFDGPALEN